MKHRPGCRRAAGMAVALWTAASFARADGVLDVSPNPLVPFSSLTTVFPNWVQAPIASLTITECDDTTCAGCTSGPLVGLTVFNWGTATGGPGQDLTGVSFQVACGSKTNTAITPMTFAGTWNVGGYLYPAWTWAGSIGWGSDPCSAPSFGCSCAVGLYLYADIGPCPTDGNTVELGPGFDDTLNPAWPGGLYDSCGFAAPWGQVTDTTIKTIRYVMKTADQTVAAPGDTVDYTVFYGRPGTGSLASLWVFDTLPAYTHIKAFGAKAPDTGWDPDPGPPLRLRWTVPGPLAAAGGPTAEVDFTVSVDWGNGEAFEPGSGDVAAPEGTFLFNGADLSWSPANGCPPGRTSNSPSVVVKRYLFWMLGDNDVLLAGKPGLPDDEIVYTLYVKNLSTTKTWWNVMLWDTVPAQLDVWSPNYGFEDPCTGWTMTPSGCAAATPGWAITGAKTTLLTWKLDMPPQYTLSLRWTGRLFPTVAAGSTVINQSSLYEIGKTGILGGTGAAVAPRGFTHQALVVLRTTFVSYVGWAGDDNAWFKGCVNQTYFIAFYPLNKAADFQLYKKWCCSAAPCDATCNPWAVNGGVSPRMDIFAGTCTGGPAIDWETGCKVERAPARYIPNQFATGAQPAYPFNFIHKMVANTPMVWELTMCLAGGNQDANTYSGTSSLSFAGYIVYSYLRSHVSTTYVQDNLYIVNTDDTQPTTIFVFQWNYATLNWDFMATQDLYNGSHWGYCPPALDPGHFRVLSSTTKLIAQKAWVGIGVGGAYNDLGTLAPNRENGGLVNDPAIIPSTFYLFAGNLPGAADVAIVGNVGLATASYDLYRYMPLDPTAVACNTRNFSVDLVGNAGTWLYVTQDQVPAGLATAGNAHVYGVAYDNSTFLTRYRLYKVVLRGGGPIQTYCGRSIIDEYSGGSMLHPSNPAGAQAGREYWLHTDCPDHTVTGNFAVTTLDVFVPKVNCGVNLTSGDGASATYTTNDIDECISYREITAPAKGALRNWKFQVTAGGNPGDIIVQYIAENIGEKFYTAPFLRRGVFYDILTPPSVFSGQSFWITVNVIDSGGGLKTDYCGTSSFTSTDPAALVENTPMDSYNFTWHSSAACSAASNQNGTRLFFNVTLVKMGLQTIVATDTQDGTISGLATLMVVAADVKLQKIPPFQLAASGDTVQFKICWSNYSSASAFTFVITDAVPLGTTYLPEVASALDCGNTDGVPLAVGYATVQQGTPPAAFTTTAGTLPAGVTWLRWTVPVTGVGTTGCGCFRVVVK